MSIHTKAFFEIFDEIENAPKADKIKVIHSHSSPQLKEFLGLVFDTRIKWLVPEGKPPYKEPEEDVNHLKVRLRQELRLLQHFVSTGPYKDLKQVKRESMFISLLQTIHPKDVELIIYAKDHRKLPQKSVTKKLIAEAFPNLAKDW